MNDVASEAPQAPTQGVVAIPEASDADLEAFLESAQTEAEEDAGEDEVAEQKSAEPVKPAPTQDTNPDEVKLTKKDYEELVARIDKQKSQIDQQELFIKRRSSELGEARRQLRERNAALQDGLEEKHIANPREAIQAELEIRENAKQIQDLDNQETRLNTVVESQRMFAHYANPEEANDDDMAQALLDDGIPPDAVQAFKQNKHEFAAPETLIQLHRRARAEKALKAVLGYAQHLFNENKKLAGKPGEVLNKVEAELRKGPQITGAHSQTASGRRAAINPADLSKVSDKELEELLAQMESQGE